MRAAQAAQSAETLALSAAPEVRKVSIASAEHAGTNLVSPNDCSTGVGRRVGTGVSAGVGTGVSAGVGTGVGRRRQASLGQCETAARVCAVAGGRACVEDSVRGGVHTHTHTHTHTHRHRHIQTRTL